MFVCYDLCGLIVGYFDKDLVKYHINKKFLDKNGTRMLEITNNNLEKYSKIGELEVVKWLWSKNVDITAKKNYAVRWASYEGNLDVVKFLVSKGADITARDNYAFRWADYYGRFGVVEFLLSKGSKL